MLIQKQRSTSFILLLASSLPPSLLECLLCSPLLLVPPRTHSQPAAHRISARAEREWGMWAYKHPNPTYLKALFSDEKSSC